MAGTQRSTPQRPIAIPDRLYRQALEIAKLRDERDLLGKGLPAVVRRALTQYVRRHADLLPPDLRD